MKIKVLTALTDPPTREPSDFSHVTDGEICVMPIVICDNPSCGCGNAFVGLVSHKGTTTAVVAEVDLTGDDITAMLSSYVAQWEGILDFEGSRAMWHEMVAIAAGYPSGVILRFHAEGDRWVIRSHRPAA